MLVKIMRCVVIMIPTIIIRRHREKTPKKKEKEKKIRLAAEQAVCLVPANRTRYADSATLGTEKKAAVVVAPATQRVRRVNVIRYPRSHLSGARCKRETERERVCVCDRCCKKTEEKMTSEIPETMHAWRKHRGCSEPVSSKVTRDLTCPTLAWKKGGRGGFGCGRTGVGSRLGFFLWPINGV